MSIALLQASTKQRAGLAVYCVALLCALSLTASAATQEVAGRNEPDHPVQQAPWDSKAKLSIYLRGKRVEQFDGGLARIESNVKVDPESIIVLEFPDYKTYESVRAYIKDLKRGQGLIDSYALPLQEALDKTTFEALAVELVQALPKSLGGDPSYSIHPNDYKSHAAAQAAFAKRLTSRMPKNTTRLDEVMQSLQNPSDGAKFQVSHQVQSGRYRHDAEYLSKQEAANGSEAPGSDLQGLIGKFSTFVNTQSVDAGPDKVKMLATELMRLRELCGFADTLETLAQAVLDRPAYSHRIDLSSLPDDKSVKRFDRLALEVQEVDSDGIATPLQFDGRSVRADFVIDELNTYSRVSEHLLLTRRFDREGEDELRNVDWETSVGLTWTAHNLPFTRGTFLSPDGLDLGLGAHVTLQSDIELAAGLTATFLNDQVLLLVGANLTESDDRYYWGFGLDLLSIAREQLGK